MFDFTDRDETWDPRPDADVMHRMWVMHERKRQCSKCPTCFESVSTGFYCDTCMLAAHDECTARLHTPTGVQYTSWDVCRSCSETD